MYVLTSSEAIQCNGKKQKVLCVVVLDGSSLELVRRTETRQGDIRISLFPFGSVCLFDHLSFCCLSL